MRLHVFAQAGLPASCAWRKVVVFDEKAFQRTML
jgi:hypothetical protein